MNTIDVILNKETIDTEVKLIGALIADNTLINDLRVNENYFISDTNKKILRAIKQLNSSNKNIDIVSLHDKVGKFVTVTQLTEISEEGYIYRNSFETLQSKIVDNLNKRKCLDISNMINEKLIAGEDTQSIFNQITNLLSKDDVMAAKTYSVSEVMESTLDRIESNYKAGGAITGMKTGYKKLDAILNGIEKKKYIIIGARPGKGKTAFSLELSRRLAIKNKVMFFSLEMAKEELGERLISSVNTIQGYKVKTGNLTESEFDRIMNGMVEISNLNLTVDDTESLSVEELSRRATRHKNKYGLDVVVVDYLTLLNTEEKYKDTREKVNIISNKLRQLSKKLDVAVICLCQLNRAVEGRQDKRPTLADLKESGNIEQDANIVLFIHSGECDSNDKEQPEELSLIISKNRSGVSNKTIKFNYYKRTQIIDEKYN